MNTTNKRNLLIGFIVLLLVINLTALVTFLYNNNVKQKRIDEIRKVQQQIEISGVHRYLKEELKLNEEQFQKFREVGKKSFKQSREIANLLDEKRLEFMDELTRENPDFQKLDDISREMGDLHYELKKNTIDHFFELKKICNPDQQKALEKLFMQMIQKEGQRPMNRSERGRFKGKNRGHND